MSAGPDETANTGGTTMPVTNVKSGPRAKGKFLSPAALWWALVALTLLWFGGFALFPAGFFYVGVNHFGVWFLDTFALLASNDAVTRGLNPYVPNPLDYLVRPHVYSDWWLHLRDLGLTRADVTWLGGSLVAAFLATALAQLRPRTPRELLGYAMVLCSAPVLLAVERANNDLVIFLLLSTVVPAVLSHSRAIRFFAAIPIALAAGLKFYPAVAALTLAAGTEKRELRARLVAAAALLALVGLQVAPDIPRSGRLVPRADGLMTFGAVNLLESTGLSGRTAAVAGLLLALVIGGGFWKSRLFREWKITRENEASWLRFVLGASLLTGCFFAGTNYSYRWIFALWLAPLLWSLPRDPAAPAKVRRVAALTAGLLMFVLWSDAVASAFFGRLVGHVPAPDLMRWAGRFFLFEQPVLWAFFGCLLGFLAHFAQQACHRLLARD